MRRALWAVCLTGLFLLMLSALVVTPEDALPREAPPLPAGAPAVWAAAPASAAQTGQQETDGGGMRFLCAMPGVPASDVSSRAHSCDSNGRILSSARYVDSVYQLFRPEVAGG